MKPRFVVIMFLVLAFLGLFISGLGSSSPVYSQGSQLLTNSEFSGNVTGWEASWSDDCGEYPNWLDEAFLPEPGEYFGLAIPNENCIGLINGFVQSFYVSGHVGWSYELDVFAYSDCNLTSTLTLGDLGLFPYTNDSGVGFHNLTISGVILDDSAPWYVDFTWSGSCAFPDETWVDYVRFTVFEPTPTPEPTSTNTPEPTSTNTPEPPPTNTPEPTSTNTPEPFPTATPTITPTPSPGGGGTPTFFPLLRAINGSCARSCVYAP